jgi:hypothetical protein
MPFGSGGSRPQSYRSVSRHAHTALPTAPPGRVRGEADVSENRRDVPPTPENSYEARAEDWPGPRPSSCTRRTAR